MNYCGNITKSVMLWEIFVDLLMSVSMSRRGSEENLKDSGSGMKTRRDRETKGRDTGSILDDYQTEETRDKCTTTYTTSRERNISGQIMIGDRMYGEEQSM